MLLQSQFNENQVFINPSSYLTEAIATRSCEGEANNPLDTIYAGLARVFYFQININQLVLNDPYGVTVFKFKRVVQPSTVDIVGVWTMSQYANTRTSLSVEISATQMTLCQGMAVYSYSFPATRNSILLTVVSNTCPSEQLIAAIESVRFYRLDQGVLDLYDNDIALAVEVVYSQEYDPSESIFKAAATRTSPTSMTSSSSSSASYTPSAGISSTNLSGNWSIVTLFDIPFPNTPYSLSMSLSSISLLGGCNSHTFPYTLNTTGQIITIGEGISTMKACVSDDDQLYISGIKKMYKYLISSTSSGFSLNFYAESGQIGYALEIKNAVASVQSQDLAFGEGVVLMLLLGRRDLARAVVRINGSSLSYTGCNTITHGFTVSD